MGSDKGPSMVDSFRNLEVYPSLKTAYSNLGGSGPLAGLKEWRGSHM
jgi:hypothetical protein